MLRVSVSKKLTCFDPHPSCSRFSTRAAPHIHITRPQHVSHLVFACSATTILPTTHRPSRQQVQHTLAALALETAFPSTTTPPQESTLDPPNTVAMQFEVHCPAASRMLLVGSADALGAWDVHNAVPLCSTDNHWWSTTHNLHLPVGALIEYKYIMVDPSTHELHWQHGTNESAQLPWDSEGRVWILKDEWDHSDHLLLTGAHENDAVQCVLVWGGDVKVCLVLAID